MSSLPIDPNDEFVHTDYPRDDPTPWKENWYFNFIDRDNNAWGINHVSLMREKQQARFMAMHIVDGRTAMYINHIDIDENFKDITDGKLTFEFIEPLEKMRLKFDGPKHAVDLEYTKRFPVFDYAEHKAKRKPGGKKESLSINHYEQGLYVKGTLTKDGDTRPIECLGHRDHSWGYRNESKISGWNWVAVQFPERTFNLSQVRVKTAFMNRGFVSDKDGNVGIRKVDVGETKRDAHGAPLSTTYIATDEQGRTWTLTSERFSHLFLPDPRKGDGGVVVYENFSDYTLKETGEQGAGIDEYLQNAGM